MATIPEVGPSQPADASSSRLSLSPTPPSTGSRSTGSPSAFDNLDSLMAPNIFNPFADLLESQNQIHRSLVLQPTQYVPVQASNTIAASTFQPQFSEADQVFFTKRRLLHFLYAAGEPLSLSQLAMIPTINTVKKDFEPEKLIRFDTATAAETLASWFGRAVVFNPLENTVSLFEAFRKAMAEDNEHKSQNLEAFSLSGEIFIGHVEAHAETLLVCATYLLLASGGAGENMSGMGFQFLDQNDLTPYMLQSRTTPGSDPSWPSFTEHEPPTPSPNQLPIFYSLWEYATLNWPRHFASIAPSTRSKKEPFTALVLLAAESVVSLMLSFHFLTWLENLYGSLSRDNEHDFVPIAFAQAQVLGTLKRWVQAVIIRQDDPTAVKMCSRALHWVTLLHIMDILTYIETVSRSQSPTRRMELRQTLYAQFMKIQSYESLSRRDCDMIASNKCDVSYYKYVMETIITCNQPNIIDRDRRFVFYVDQKNLSGGALQLECVDMETGMIIGKDSIWTKKFLGWEHRVLISRSANHLALQVIAQKPTQEKMQRLLQTHVWEIREPEMCRFGEGIVGKHWSVDNELVTTMNSGSLPGLHDAGQLVFNDIEGTVETPTGVWELKSQTKLRGPMRKPAFLTKCPNARYEARL